MRTLHLSALAAAALLALAGCGRASTPEATGTATEAVSTSTSSSTSSTGSSTTTSSTTTATSTGSSTTGSSTGAGLGDVFEAFGTEPFWNVAVDHTTLTYTQVGEPDRTLTATKGGSPEAPTYTGSGQTTFSLTITKGECSDGMSDNTYHYKAVFTYGDKTLNGCAHQK